MIEHFGNAEGGHYVAYRRLFPEEAFGIKNRLWVLCDDSTIELINEEEVLKRSAYMLMYERVV